MPRYTFRKGDIQVAKENGIQPRKRRRIPLRPGVIVIPVWLPPGDVEKPAEDKERLNDQHRT